MIICSCEGVSEKEVRRAARCGAQNVQQLGRLCGAGTGCNSCHCDLKKILKQEKSRQAVSSPQTYVGEAIPVSI